MTKTLAKWKIPPEVRGERLGARGLPNWFLNILIDRGIETEEQIEEYLNSKYENIAAPENFLNIELVIERIRKAKEAGEKITVYGDYDVDGITATAIVFETLSKIGMQNLETYIPSREEEGYGLNLEALQEITAKGSTLIIAVDCGITSGELINTQKDLDFIVIDHHTIDAKKLPKRGFLLHPSLSKDGVEYNLSAAGMAFVFAQAVQQSYPNEFPSGQEKWLLDLVALSTICDIVPLTGTNRLLAYFGLLVLGKTKREGLRALMEVAGVESEPDAYTAGFLLGPRLNAAGRLESAQKSLKLLLTKDKDEARQLALELNRINLERQLLCERIIDEAQQQVEGSDREAPIHLLSDQNWPRGVVGIVASRITDYYHRPTIIFEDDGEYHHGSARSIDGLNIVDLLSEVSDHVIKYGGHAKAAGLTVGHEHFVIFKEKLLALVDEKIKEIDLNRELVIDTEIKPEEINDEAMALLEKMEPTGFGNKRPVFMMRGVEVCEVKRVGKGKEHLKFSILSSRTAHLKPLSAIAFNEERDLKEGVKYDFAFTLKYNVWNNRKSIDLRIVDLRESA